MSDKDIVINNSSVIKLDRHDNIVRLRLDGNPDLFRMWVDRNNQIVIQITGDESETINTQTPEKIAIVRDGNNVYINYIGENQILHEFFTNTPGYIDIKEDGNKVFIDFIGNIPDYTNDIIRLNDDSTAQWVLLNDLDNRVRANTTAIADFQNIGSADIETGPETSFLNGLKQWVDFTSTVRATILTGLSIVSNAVVTATDNIITAIGKLQAQITAHKEDTDNPHNVTKSQIGLGNVDNTSDANKPISTAIQGAIDSINNSIANIQIGSANILRGTNTTAALTSTGVWSNGTWRSASTGTGTRTPVAITDAPNPDISRGWELTSTSAYIDISQDSIPVVVGQSYILSCFARLISGAAKVHFQIGKTTYLTTVTDITSTEWQKLSFLFTPISTNVSGGATNVYLGAWAASGVPGTIQICGMKLELGNKATDWSPSPWDINAAIPTVTEGTWYPTFNLSGGSIITNGSYIKVGNTVTASFYAEINITTIQSSGFLIAGLPYQNKGSKFAGGGGYMSIPISGTPEQLPNGFILSPDSSTIIPECINLNGAYGSVIANKTGVYVFNGSITYKTA